MKRTSFLGNKPGKERVFSDVTAELILSMLIANSLISSVVLVFQGTIEKFKPSSFILSLFFALFFAGLFILVRRGHKRPAVFVAVSLNFIFSLLQIWLDGGVYSPNFYELLLGIFLAVLAYGVHGGLITGILSLLTGWAATVYQTKPLVYSTQSALIIHLVTFLTLGVYFYVAIRLFRKELAGNSLLTQELRDNETRLKGLIQNLPIGAMVTNRRGEISLLNTRLIESIGYSREELKTSDDWYRLAHPDPIRAAEMREIFETRLMDQDHLIVNGESEIYSKSGQRFDCEVHASALGDEIVVLVNDISARKKAESEIARKFAQLNSLRTLDIAIVNSEGLHELLDVFLNQIAVQLGADAIWVMLSDGQNQAGFDVFTYGYAQPNILTKIESTAAMRRVVTTPEPTLIRDAASISAIYGSDAYNFSFCASIPMITKNGVIGILAVFRRDTYSPDGDWLRFFEALAGQTAIGVDRINLTDSLKSLNHSLVVAYDTTLQGWARALELRDKETEGHSRRVAEMTLQLARAVGVPESDLQDIYRGALLHDIGKMPIPDRILLKNGPLTDEEWVLMRQHPETARQLLKNIPFLQRALEIPYGHHEHWDGCGYPLGQKGDQIPLPARLFAFADVWDALSSDRPYRQAWPIVKVIEYIRERSGKQFDPHITPYFEKLILTETHQI
jgi:PAS domain S-box-containing protein/putative nucleotidyltransferase with HDIG domain